MTRQDRDLAIGDNLAYVTTCLETVAAEWQTLPKVVFAGFSQGTGMAFRAAVNRSAASVIAAGGDIPPEITPDELARLSTVLLARGTSDEWYTRGKFADDQRRLRDSSVTVHDLEFHGGHEWSGEVITAASRLLRGLYP
jgi:predicted esterase